MHFPHRVISFPIRSHASARAAFRQASTSTKASRRTATSHSAPRIAFPGQAWAHCVQPPHREASTGWAVSSKTASVSTELKRTAGPNSSVTNSADLPIHPSPARVAQVLWGKGVWYPADSTTVVVVWARARTPLSFI